MLDEKDRLFITKLLDDKLKLNARIKGLEDDVALMKAALAYYGE